MSGKLAQAGTTPPSPIGGTPETQLTFLSTGSIGLHALVFQVSANVPTGAAPIRPSVGAYQTQGAIVFIASR